MKLLTVTLNPVYDRFYHIPAFQPYRENLASKVEVFPGGKAVNVSRALTRNGYDNTALLLLGRENCAEFEKAIRAEGIAPLCYYTDGHLRENLTFLSDGIPETRVCVNTFSATLEILQAILDDLKQRIDGNTAVVCSGKFPKGLTVVECMAFIREMMAITPYVALDSQTFGANEIVALKPWLIKPNSEEIEALVGHPCHGLEALLEAADSLFQGGIAHVLVSLGGDGALYCGELGRYRIEVPAIRPFSTIGAGDSTLAGFLSAYSEGLDAAACLTRACAFGTAACLEAGTNPPLPDKVVSISKQIRITAL